MDNLIYDRTKSDVTNLTSKGYYNASDLNRIEEWTSYLATKLVTRGYNISITTKTNWTEFNFPTYAEIERIRSNIYKIMTGFKYISSIYSASSTMNYTRANNYEKILQEIYNMLRGMSNRYVYCGVSKMGQNRTWQNRFRTIYKYVILYSTWQETIDKGIETWEEIQTKEWGNLNNGVDYIES